MTSPATSEKYVSQAFSQFLRTWNYRPVTSWRDFFNPQFIINSNSGDVAVENDVLAEVGSYGKQLGTILDALNVVLSALPLHDLLPSDQRAIDRLRTLTEDVNQVVARHRPDRRGNGLTTMDVGDFLDRLRALGQEDPTAAQVVAEALAKGVRDLTAPTP